MFEHDYSFSSSSVFALIDDSCHHQSNYHTVQYPGRQQPLASCKSIQARTFHLTSKVERSAPVISDAQVQDLFSLWNNALATLDPDAVAKRYSSKKTVLLPTVSDLPRTDYDGLHDYLPTFWRTNLKVKSWNPMSFKVKIGAWMQEFMNSPWVLVATRSRVATPLFTPMKMGSGRFVTITLLSCQREESKQSFSTFLFWCSRAMRSSREDKQANQQS